MIFRDMPTNILLFKDAQASNKNNIFVLGHIEDQDISY